MGSTQREFGRSRQPGRVGKPCTATSCKLTSASDHYLSDPFLTISTVARASGRGPVCFRFPLGGEQPLIRSNFSSDASLTYKESCSKSAS